jgi:hypothetical protein
MQQSLLSSELLIIMLPREDLNEASPRNSPLSKGSRACLGAFDLALLNEYTIDIVFRPRCEDLVRIGIRVSLPFTRLWWPDGNLFKLAILDD